MTDAPVLYGLGAFDSQNLAFWDANIGMYRACWWIFTAGVTTDEECKPGGIRAIRTATSADLINRAEARRFDIRRFARSAVVHESDQTLSPSTPYSDGFFDLIHWSWLVGVHECSAGVEGAVTACIVVATIWNRDYGRTFQGQS